MDTEQKKSSRDKLNEALTNFLEQQTTATKAKDRRWNIFLAVAIFFGVLNAVIVGLGTSTKKHTDNYAALVRIDGTIGTGKLASIGLLGETLEQAFSDKKARCVALVINSPGGMVTQSQLIHDQIKSLAKEHNKKVIAVGEDFMASGGYMIAAAAESIHAPKSSIVGSIGVIMSGYDLSDLAQRYGVKDRTYTAGSMKDPFNPLVKPNDAAVAKAHEILEDLHTQFIDMVKESRGQRLVKDQGDLFNGSFWTGRRAMQLGLIDDNLDLQGALKKDCGADSFVAYEPKLGISDMLSFLSMR